MKKKIFVVFMLLALVVVGMSAEDKYVIDYNNANAVIGYVDFFYVNVSSNLFVAIDGARPQKGIGISSGINLTENTKKSGYFAIDMTKSNAKELYSLLLLSKTMDYRVMFRLSDTEMYGYNSLAYIRSPYKQ